MNNNSKNNFKNKYLKYNKKISALNSLLGGSIDQNDVLKFICSIGFEFETGGFTKLICDDASASLLRYTEPFLLKNLDNIAFHVTEDWSVTTFNTLTAETDDSAQRDIFSLFIGGLHGSRQKNYNISIFNDERHNHLSNTEFHVTFIDIIPETNCIANKFKRACEIIYKYLTDDCTKHRSLLRVLVNGSHINKLPMRETLYDPATNFVYLPLTASGNIIDSYYFVQMTVGVRYGDVYKVLQYLLKMTGSEQTYNECLGYAKSCMDALYTHFPINPTQNSQTVLLYNWLSMVLFKFFCYQKYISRPADSKRKYLKEFMGFLVRHRFSEIFPAVDFADRDNLFDTIAQFFTTIMIDHILAQKIVTYITNLKVGNESVDTGIDRDNVSKKFTYNASTQILLIEIRNFNNQIKDFLILLDDEKITHEILRQVASA